jgi:hypothetical protein
VTRLGVRAERLKEDNDIAGGSTDESLDDAARLATAELFLP